MVEGPAPVNAFPGFSPVAPNTTTPPPAPTETQTPPPPPPQSPDTSQVALNQSNGTDQLQISQQAVNAQRGTAPSAPTASQAGQPSIAQVNQNYTSRPGGIPGQTSFAPQIDTSSLNPQAPEQPRGGNIDLSI
jgi:hypothetical protein